MSDLIKITNKYAKDCSCGARVEEGEGFAILNKDLPKDQQKWATVCAECMDRQEEQEELEKPPF